MPVNLPKGIREHASQSEEDNNPAEMPLHQCMQMGNEQELGTMVKLEEPWWNYKTLIYLLSQEHGGTSYMMGALQFSVTRFSEEIGWEGGVEVLMSMLRKG